MKSSTTVINPEWINEIGTRKMTYSEKEKLETLVITIEAVSCREAFRKYNELMEKQFIVGDTINFSSFKLKDMIYVGPDGGLFSIFGNVY